MSDQGIVYLLNNHSKDITNFRTSIRLLVNNYINNFPCDIICFYESDFPKEELEFLQKVLKTLPIYFHQITLALPNYSDVDKSSIPEYFPHPDFPQAQGFSMGYRHMCRFFAGDIFSNQVLKKYKYIWRLDTDSFIVEPIKYNVFDKLKNNNCIYGYINIQHDHPGVIKNLWELSKQYFQTINKDHIFRLPDINFHKNRVFYTNFEIFDMDWFRSKDYQDFFSFIDSTAGIYKYRWGDHSIRYIGVNSLADPYQIYFFNDIKYVHQEEYFNNRVTNTFYGN